MYSVASSYLLGDNVHTEYMQINVDFFFGFPESIHLFLVTTILFCFVEPFSLTASLYDLGGTNGNSWILDRPITTY